MPKVKCKLCKTAIERDDAYRTALQSFCSVDHYKEYFASSQKKASKPKVDPGWDDQRKVIIKLDGGRCRVCGTKYNLHVHHIRYRSEGGTHDEDNLITLCIPHHDLIHSDKNKYQQRCLAIVEKRKQGDAFTRIKIGD